MHLAFSSDPLGFVIVKVYLLVVKVRETCCCCAVEKESVVGVDEMSFKEANIVSRDAAADAAPAQSEWNRAYMTIYRNAYSSHSFEILTSPTSSLLKNKLLHKIYICN